MERLLTTSKELADKINSNDNAANELLHQCEVLQQKFKAMIQYQSAVQEISGGEDHPRGPPRIEFSYIRQLQQDNSELRSLLDEHQAALDMIMTKYREQMVLFINTKSMEESLAQDQLAEEVRSRTDQLCEMASVMYQAARAEDNMVHHSQEQMAQLEYENKYLRDILSSTLSSVTSTTPEVAKSPHEKKEEEVPVTGGMNQQDNNDDNTRSLTPTPNS